MLSDLVLLLPEILAMVLVVLLAAAPDAVEAALAAAVVAAAAAAAPVAVHVVSAAIQVMKQPVRVVATAVVDVVPLLAFQPWLHPRASQLRYR
jgi:hypothetical protein